MGKGRDKRKKAKEKRGDLSKAHDQVHKEQRAAEKQARRAQKKAQGGEDDLDAILAALDLADGKGKKKAQVRECGRPSPRSHSSITASTSNQPRDNCLYIFGGEFYDGKKTYVFGDLFKYTIEKGRWEALTLPHGPKPRSGHQAVLLNKCLWVFGGEYTSPNQEKFKHFRDLWRLDLEALEWDQITVKGGPSARSGHRMAVYGGRIVLFGGYFDTGDDMKYYGDLWTFDTGSMKWASHGHPSQLAPAPRSACQMVVDKDALYLYGGYAKVKGDADLEHGKTFSDTWKLDLLGMEPDLPEAGPTWPNWEKVKKAGIAPSERSGFSMVAQPGKGRSFFFGGVKDHEVKDGESMMSEFFNEAYFFVHEKQRWFPVTMRPPKLTKAEERSLDRRGVDVKDLQAGAGSVLVIKRDKEQTPEEAAAIKIQARCRGFLVRKAYKLYKLGGKISELLYSPAVCKVPGLSKLRHPHPRINGALAVVQNTLYLYGGVFESADVEITLDDLWSLNLNKLDGWQCLMEATQSLDQCGGSDWEEVGSDEEA